MLNTFFNWLFGRKPIKFFHRHKFVGPKNIGFNDVVRDTTYEFICECGCGFEIDMDGEILTQWDTKGNPMYGYINGNLRRRYIKDMPIEFDSTEVDNRKKDYRGIDGSTMQMLKDLLL